MYFRTSVFFILSLSSTAIATENNKSTLSMSESLIFSEIKSQCYMKGQLEDEKQWLISKTSNKYYEQKFSAEAYHNTCVKSFKISKTEVSLGLYQRYAAENDDIILGDKGCYVVGDNGWENNPNANWQTPTFEQQKDQPVVCISYNEANKFIDWLNKKLKPNMPYRLPTEAEWELAARGSQKQRNTWHYWGNDPDSTQACHYGNVSDLTLNDHKAQDMIFNCRDGVIQTAAVRSYQPNDYALYNMLGNVQEFTCSGYSEKISKMQTTCESKELAEHITVKGGAWYYPPIYNRAAFRGALPRHLRFYGVGFRLAQDRE